MTALFKLPCTVLAQWVATCVTFPRHNNVAARDAKRDLAIHQVLSSIFAKLLIPTLPYTMMEKIGFPVVRYTYIKIRLRMFSSDSYAIES